MPEILELLKRERCAAKATISAEMRAIAGQKELIFRMRAVSYSLTSLKRHGWSIHAKRGTWCVTQSGTETTLNRDQIDPLGKEIWGG